MSHRTRAFTGALRPFHLWHNRSFICLRKTTDLTQSVPGGVYADSQADNWRSSNCLVVEPDIDYFKDTLAHLLFEVAVNATDPRAVYTLRWIAGQRAAVPEVDPQYTIGRA